jgi:hypothetical protein
MGTMVIRITEAGPLEKRSSLLMTINSIHVKGPEAINGLEETPPAAVDDSV